LIASYGNDIETRYRVAPAANGGWILFNNLPDNFLNTPMGAFTDAAALLRYLQKLTAHKLLK
jgi:hypothetical protein